MTCGCGGEKLAFCIKLEIDMSLSTTVYEPIYRGESLGRKIIYLKGRGRLQHRGPLISTNIKII